MFVSPPSLKGQAVGSHDGINVMERLVIYTPDRWNAKTVKPFPGLNLQLSRIGLRIKFMDMIME